MLKVLSLLITFFLIKRIQSQQKIDYLSPLFTQDGKCPSNVDEAMKKFCIPYKPITFDYLWSPKVKQPALDGYNDYLQQAPFFYSKFIAYYDQSGKMRLKTQDKIEKFRRIYKFNSFENFGYNNYTQQEFKDFPAYEEHIKFPEIPFERQDHKFIFTLLYHLYWNEKSIYKMFFHFLPPKPDIPLYTFTHYEMKLLEGDQAFNLYMYNYEVLTTGYKEFIQKLDKHWSEDQRESFFKFDKIPYEDYVYADFIRKKYGQITTNKTSNESYFYINFGALGFQFKLGNTDFSVVETLPPDPNNENDNNRTQETLMQSNDQDIPAGTDVLLNYNEKMSNFKEDDSSDKYFLLGGVIPEENEKDCIEIEMIDPTLGQSYGAPQYACVSLYNEKILMYHATGNLINMDQKQYNYCKELVLANELQFITPEQEKKFVFDICNHPDWKKANIWDVALENIDEMLIKYKKKLKQTKVYYELRKKHGLSEQNALLILTYLKKRLDLLKDIKYYIDAVSKNPSKFRKIFENLNPAGYDPNPFSEANKKKYQEEKEKKEREKQEREMLKQKKKEEKEADLAAQQQQQQEQNENQEQSQEIQQNTETSQQNSQEQQKKAEEVQQKSDL